MKKIILIILILIIPKFSFADSIFLNQKFPSKNQDIKVGDEILIEVRILTEENFYNAVSGIVKINTEDFLIKKINTGNNIITAWIDNPSKSNNGEIFFSGIMAGGFTGNGLIFELSLVPKNQGNMKVLLDNVSIFLNDGLGTEKKISSSDLNINVRNLEKNEENFIIFPSDKISPEPFDVFLIRDENLADGKYVLVFEAIDKGSGVRMYEVIEGRKVILNAQSPFTLTNQKLNKKIFVKAIDQEGNERLVRVNIPDKICIGINCFKDTYAIAFIGLILIISFIIWRKQSKEFKKLSKAS